MKFKALLRLGLGFLCGVISWFAGWLLYVQLDLWHQIKPAEFQNILVVMLGLCTLVGAGLAHRSMRSVTRSPRTKGHPELKKLREDFESLREETLEKFNDIHAFCPICKTREEAKTK